VINIPEELLNFDPAVLKTPNTYDTNFQDPPDASGVYFVVLPNYDKYLKPQPHKILYIGSAKSLKVRYDRHEVIRLLSEFYGYVQFYFKEIQNYREVEKALIGKYKPKYNKQWIRNNTI